MRRRRPFGLCLVMGLAMFMCLCMCGAIGAFAGGHDNSGWDGEGSPIRIDPPNANITAPDTPADPAEPTYYDYSGENHGNWYRAWGIFTTLTLLMVVGGVIGMAFYSSRRLPTLQKAKRPTII
ncbi:MAG: hypothetical protein HY862_16700 [Chloroflexi bacterium]|nr:hypothetical protein [Chloroflexota bacterium]